MDNKILNDTEENEKKADDFTPEEKQDIAEIPPEAKVKQTPAWLEAIIDEGDPAKAKLSPMEVMASRVEALTKEVEFLRAELDAVRQGTSCEGRHFEEQDQAERADENRQTQKTAQAARKPIKKKEPEQKPKNKALNVISNIVFYVVIVAIVAGAFLIKSSSGGRPTVIAGYSAFTVLTSSMEDVYPKGSLIVSKSVDAGELEVGDDITFMVSETSSVTHRIISITENYAGTGKRGFETQGVMNENPDKDMVAAANVVGKVVFCSTALGKTASFVKQNWPILAFSLVVIVALIYFLKWNARREESEDAPDRTKKARVRK